MTRLWRAARLLLPVAFLCCLTLASAQPTAPAGQEPQPQGDLGWSGPTFGLLGFSHAPVDESSHLLVVCRELKDRIEVLGSQIVPGPLKPAYRVYVRPQQAQLLDDQGAPITSAFYEVERELRWTGAKPGSNELTGGSIPAPEVIFTVRVPFSPGARSLRLARVHDAGLLESLQAQSIAPPRTFTEPVQTDTLLTIPLAELPGLPGVAH